MQKYADKLIYGLILGSLIILVLSAFHTTGSKNKQVQTTQAEVKKKVR